MKQGRTPTITEVAEEAMVSRATAYRYFANPEAMLAEAPLDELVPTVEQLFARDTSSDPEERVDRAEAAMHDTICGNEAQFRVMLAHMIRRANDAEENEVPIRQNRRTALIQAALAPARHRFSDPVYKKLCAALALFFGTESMVIFSDVLRLDKKTARQVKSWAVRALVRTALRESKR